MLFGLSVLSWFLACAHGKVFSASPLHGIWRVVNQDLPSSQRMSLSIALRQPQIKQVEDFLLSDERKPHLSKAKVDSLRAPDKQELQAVLEWLSDHGIHGVPRGAWIDFTTNVSTIERLLQTNMAQYRSQEGNVHVLRTEQYSVPDFLDEMIEFIHPIDNFMPLQRQALQSRQGISNTRSSLYDGPVVPCTDNVTVSCMRQAFNMHYQPDSSEPSPVRFGVAGFLDQNANFVDIQQFLEEFAPDIAHVGYNFSIELLPQANNSQDLKQSGSEASLDLEYAMALGYPSNVIYYKGPDEGQMEPYLKMFEYLLALPDNKIPHLFTISYAVDEPYVPVDYATRTCSAIAALAARGMTTLAASGDGGAAGAGTSFPCQTLDGKRNITKAVFPASCPYVTSVGATGNGPKFNGTGGLNSGGGFSVIFPRPSWQEGIIQPYIQQLDGHLEQYYNANMRALPDITTFGELFSVVTRGFKSLVGGTSASTPTLAAMIALINDKRLRNGKQSLGFINKALYSNKTRAILTDILNGTSTSCKFGDDTPGGWPAAKGWDAISGVGRPDDFVKFMDVLYEL